MTKVVIPVLFPALYNEVRCPFRSLCHLRRRAGLGKSMLLFAPPGMDMIGNDKVIHRQDDSEVRYTLSQECHPEHVRFAQCKLREGSLPPKVRDSSVAANAPSE